jgi:hypothetical protein
LAKLYQLPLVNNPCPTWWQLPASLPPSSSEDNNNTTTTATTTTNREYSVQELTTVVSALVPEQGGTIVPHPDQMEGREIRYQVFDRMGQVRRVVFVGCNDGRVYEVHNYDQVMADYKKTQQQHSRDCIRLGLGDFVFYATLVSKAAWYSWTTFCVTTLVILCGLGVTLILLAWYEKALPALPISIFLGVIFFLSTRFVLQPWIEDVFREAMYV